MIQAAKAARDIDVIIDGPNVSALNDNQGMRGSSNQRVIHLTNRLHGIDFTRKPRQTEIHITDGELLFVGVPPTGVVPGVITNLGAMISSSVMGEVYEWTKTSDHPG